MIAGASGVLLGHPLDTVKVKLQITGKVANLSWSLYRGLIPPLVTTGLISSVNFSIYEKCKEYLSNGNQKDVNLNTIFIAGAFAGTCISIVTSPISLVKVQQQAVTQHGILSCAKSLYRTHGIKTFYRGFSMMFLMESFGRGVYLWTYELVKKQMDPTKEYCAYDHTTNTKAVAAAIAGTFSWAVVYHCDVIKSRLQADIGGKTYRGPLHCFRSTWEEGEKSTPAGKSRLMGGLKHIYRGMGFTMIRAAPVAALVLPVYDSIKDNLERSYVSSLS